MDTFCRLHGGVNEACRREKRGGIRGQMTETERTNHEIIREEEREDERKRRDERTGFNRGSSFLVCDQAPREAQCCKEPAELLSLLRHAFLSAGLRSDRRDRRQLHSVARGFTR